MVSSVRSALGAAALAIGAWYAALVWIHSRTVDAPASWWICGAAALTAAVLMGIGFRWIRQPPRQPSVDACVLGLGIATLANTAIYLFLFPEPQYLHALALVLIGGSFFLTSSIFLGALGAGVVAVVATTVARSESAEEWAQSAIMLTTSGVLAIVIHIWRRLYMDRLGALQLDNENRQLELERSIETLELEVAEKERLQETLLKTQNLESLGRMAGGVAHDFNNLLLIILGHAEFARRDLPESSAAQGDLAEVITAAERAALLTGQLLSYAGGSRLDDEPLDVNELVRATLALVEASLPASASLTCDLHPAQSTVRGDAAQLQQIVMNLLLNAGEALPDSGGQISVRTSMEVLDRAAAGQLEPPESRPAATFVCIEVRDTGAGIAEEDQIHVFDPFFTTKPQGRGLGLAAALGIARSHGGGFSVDSDLGRGSCFRLFLPASMDRVRDAGREDDLPFLAGRRILVVDDEAAIRSFVRRVLESRGCFVEEASDGEKALERAAAVTGLDGVVLDMTMPGLSGSETYIRLRERWPSLPVLLSSGYEEERAAEGLIREPATAFLRKPYPNASLVEALAGILEPDWSP